MHHGILFISPARQRSWVRIPLKPPEFLKFLQKTIAFNVVHQSARITSLNLCTKISSFVPRKRVASSYMLRGHVLLRELICGSSAMFMEQFAVVREHFSRQIKTFQTDLV